MEDTFGVRAFVLFCSVENRSLILIDNSHFGTLRNCWIHIEFVICDQKNIIILRQEIRNNSSALLKYLEYTDLWLLFPCP